MLTGGIMSLEYLDYVAGISRSNRLARNKTNENTTGKKKINHFLNIKNDSTHESVNLRTKSNGNNNYKKSILIAESDSSVNSILGMFVSAMGYDYEIVESGSVALDRIGVSSRKRKKHYDVIILDTHLDEGPGLNIAEEIRNNDFSQRIMIISQASKNELNTRLLKKIQIKDGDLFTKPFRFSDLLCAIEK